MVGLTGYLSGEYAGALQEWGKPIRLPRSKSWVLRRPIPDTRYYDAMGPYPLFCCNDWGKLADDMVCLYDMVSLVVVADPTAQTDFSAFDFHREFKTHHIVDGEYAPSRHHRRYARKARRDGVRVFPNGNVSDWCELYDNLISRHSITGIQTFSRSSFLKQFSVPGLHVYTAKYEDEVVSMLLFYQHNGTAYYHLGASSDRGYELCASFALMDTAIRDLLPRIIVLGGASGNQDSEDGLASFKSGWANATAPSYLCGKVIRPDVYKELTDGKYFPAYRG